ncbi:MAG: hypothetical protein LBE82_12225, partial [Chitinophagaceae bacterium]|nr:hypothetical protein [Chitinophagaceae bacterium]
MNTENEHLDTLRDIKKMMERSSRFISLSGLSGIAAGCCALVGAFFAYRQIHNASYYNTIRAMDIADSNISDTMATLFKHPLFITAIITLIAAICSAALFTWLRTKKSNIPILGTAGKRLMINVAVPLAV